MYVIAIDLIDYLVYGSYKTIFVPTNQKGGIFVNDNTINYIY